MTRTRRSTVLILLVAGGFLAAIGAVLPWVRGLAASALPDVVTRVSVPGVSSIVGVGWIVLGAGALVLCAAVELLLVRPRPVLLWPILALAAGLTVAAIGVYNLFGVTSLVADPRTGAPTGIEKLVNDPAAVGVTYDAHAGFGLYVVVVGGVLAAIGALAWLFSRGRLDEAPEQAPRPMISAPLLALGAIVAAVGAFLPWGQVSSSSTDEVNTALLASGAAHVSVGGVNQDNGGLLVLGAALVALIAAVTLFDRARVWWAAAVGLLAGLVLAGVGLHDLFVGIKKLNNLIIQVQQSATRESDPEQATLHAAVHVSIGLYVVLLAAALTLGGAVVGLRVRSAQQLS